MSQRFQMKRLRDAVSPGQIPGAVARGAVARGAVGRGVLAALLAGLLAGLAAGCNFTAFDDYSDKAPVRVSSAPDDFRGNSFGRVVTTFRNGDDAERSVLVSSAGRNTSVVFERMWNGSKITDATFTRCKRPDDCANGEGVRMR